MAVEPRRLRGGEQAASAVQRILCIGVCLRLVVNGARLPLLSSFTSWMRDRHGWFTSRRNSCGGRPAASEWEPGSS